MARILVVEDDPSVQQLVRLTLELEGHAVAIEATGIGAVGAARGCDVVVLDVMLPGVDGLEVCRALRMDAVTAAVGVVMVSALAQAGDTEAGLAAGADAYLTKPFEPRDLIRLVDEVLANRHSPGPREPIPLQR